MWVWVMWVMWVMCVMCNGCNVGNVCKYLLQIFFVLIIGINYCLVIQDIQRIDSGYDLLQLKLHAIFEYLFNVLIFHQFFHFIHTHFFI